MAIYHVRFTKTNISNGERWMSSVARQTENPNNQSQVAIGESELMTREQAVQKIQKRLEKTDFAEDQIMFNGQRQNSLNELLGAISRIV